VKISVKLVVCLHVARHRKFYWFLCNVYGILSLVCNASRFANRVANFSLYLSSTQTEIPSVVNHHHFAHIFAISYLHQLPLAGDICLFTEFVTEPSQSYWHCCPYKHQRRQENNRSFVSEKLKVQRRPEGNKTKLFIIDGRHLYVEDEIILWLSRHYLVELLVMTSFSCDVNLRYVWLPFYGSMWAFEKGELFLCTHLELGSVFF